MLRDVPDDVMVIPASVLLCARVYGHVERKVYVIDEDDVDEVGDEETYKAALVCNRERGHDGKCGDGRP